MNKNEIAFGQINPTTQALSIVASLILFCMISILVKKGYLKSGYSILWFFISGLILVLSVFIEILYKISVIVGIYYPTSTIFSILLVGLILISIHFSVEISRHEIRIKGLAQENALLKSRIMITRPKSNKGKKK